MDKYPNIIDMRLQQLKFAMIEFKVEAIYISFLPNIKYLTNFSGSQAELIIHEDKVHFFTDSRYQNQLDELYPVPGLEVHITDNIWNYCIDKKIFQDFDILGFEADKLPYAATIDIRNIVRPVKFKPTSYIFEPFTQPKGDKELENVKKAVDIAVETYETVLPLIKTRMSERELAFEIIKTANDLGSEQITRPVFITSGSRTTMMHGRPTDKNFRKGDLIIMNYSTVYNGFNCNLSRTVLLGGALTKQQQRAYESVLEVQNLIIKNVVPGVTGKHLDSIAREYIKKQRFNLPYRIGCGIGRDVYEHPYITPNNDTDMIPDKTIMNISPGIFTERFGIQARDLFRVTSVGGERLTTPPEEIPILDV